jgi:hypothetical protein
VLCSWKLAAAAHHSTVSVPAAFPTNLRSAVHVCLNMQRSSATVPTSASAAAFPPTPSHPRGLAPPAHPLAQAHLLPPHPSLHQLMAPTYALALLPAQHVQHACAATTPRGGTRILRCAAPVVPGASLEAHSMWCAHLARCMTLQLVVCVTGPPM